MCKTICPRADYENSRRSFSCSYEQMGVDFDFLYEAKECTRTTFSCSLRYKIARFLDRTCLPIRKCKSIIFHETSLHYFVAADIIASHFNSPRAQGKVIGGNLERDKPHRSGPLANKKHDPDQGKQEESKAPEHEDADKRQYPESLIPIY